MVAGEVAGAKVPDVAAIPDNNLWIVMPSIGLVLFLSALDQTVRAGLWTR